MKKSILFIAVLMGVSAANVSVANNGLKIVDLAANTAGDLNVKALDGLKFKLTIEKLQNKSYIVIKNADGEVVYSEYAGKSEVFSKVYDLSSLPDGNYSFIVANGNETIEKPFAISTEVKRTATPK